MQKFYVEDKTFEKTDFTVTPLALADYENCIFINCDFSNTDLSNIHFTECVFKHCNLSTANLAKTAFKDARFTHCKMLGLHFENCNDFLFVVDLDNCTLNLSSFYRLKLKNKSFRNCSLHEVDFTEADLSSSTFENCDLAGAIFNNTVLEKADLRTAYNYSIDPWQNRIRKAKFSMSGVVGLLDRLDIQIE